MIIPSRRKLGAAALIAAGIGAFLVPFLLHSPSTQGTSNNNNNNGGHTTTTTTTTTPSPSKTTPTGDNDRDDKGSGGSGGSTGNTGTCSEDKAKNPSHSDNDDGQHKGNAFGVLKNKMDTTVALVKAMGTHNSAFHLHHDTDTDNDKGHGHKGLHDPGDHDSSCAAGEEKHE
jgi:hypothetical protein